MVFFAGGDKNECLALAAEISGRHLDHERIPSQALFLRWMDLDRKI